MILYVWIFSIFHYRFLIGLLSPLGAIFVCRELSNYCHLWGEKRLVSLILPFVDTPKIDWGVGKGKGQYRDGEKKDYYRII